MNVPFMDLKAQYESIRDEVKTAIQEVMESCAFAGGPFVEKFEREFAAFCKCEYAIGVGSGTEALWTALLAAGVGPGDEVITVSNTFIATAEAISFCGAYPVFIDVDDRTYTMNPDRIESAITPKTKAIIPVHIFGQMADMDPIIEVARRHDLFVIEDACQAHGAQYKGMSAGSIGDISCFSFYPGKNLGAYGEAGAITTNSAELAKKMFMFRDHGQSKKYHHAMIGWNARMDGFQGAILNVKLKHLPAWNEARRKNATIYSELLSAVDGLIVPYEAKYATHVYHVYAVRIKNRDTVLKALSDKGISCGIHYPVPIHRQEAYIDSYFKNNGLKVSERVTSELLSLPMFPELNKEQQVEVKDKLCEVIQN